MVTRITRNTINELTIQPHLVCMPNYRSFFYTFHTVEPIEIGRLQEDYIESTEHIKGGYVLLTSDAINQSPVHTYLTCVKRLVDLYLHLLQAVKMLNDASIIHLNICFRNIIIKDGVLPLLAGFESATLSLLSPTKTIKTPIECRALRYIIGNKLASISSSTVRDICGDNKEEQTFLSKYINKPAKSIIESLLQLSNTWNAYSLNELFLGLLNNPHTPNSFLSKWKQCLERGTGTVGRETASYFIEQTCALMYDAEMSELTTTTTSRATLL